MKIRSVTLKNFRNHSDLHLEFTSDFVVLFGPNATGKTNVLESLYFLSIFKSFRDLPEHLFMKGTFAIELRAIVEKQGEQHLLEVFMENRDGRVMANFKIDGVRKAKKQMSRYVAAVIFEPADVELMLGASDTRRKYLNLVLSQRDPRYADNLYTFKKIISQKNELLYKIQSGKASPSELHIWNDQQVAFGSEIIMARREYTNFLNERMPEAFAAITGFNRAIEVVYEGIAGDTVQEISSQYKKILFENQEKEIRAGVSLYGPHRDDFTFMSEGSSIAPFSSRGELRAQILGLKTLELEYLTIDNDPPILLLDDVLSELDENRKAYLLQYLTGRFQTFITTTEPVQGIDAQIIDLKSLIG
jgi:DNA replication and repair protein RecF